jgi:hypothetical protein
MDTYFDENALKNWFNMQTSTYEGKPVCLKVEFYQKLGAKIERRETKSYDGDDLNNLKNNDRNTIACQKYNKEQAWEWLSKTLDSFIPSGTQDLVIYYMTSNGTAKSHYPLKLKAKQETSMLNNLHRLTNNSTSTQSNLIGTIEELLKAKQSGKTEDQIRAEIKHELEQQRKIEDLQNQIDYIQEERLGSLKKIGYILESSPELSKTFAAMIQGLAAVAGAKIGQMINGMQQQQQQTAAVGTIDVNQDNQVTVQAALAAVQKEFPDEKVEITLIKLAKVLEQNQSFKPVIIGMMDKIEL